MITFFVVLMCADLGKQDCVLYAPQSWRGPTAAIECDDARPALQLMEEQKYPGRFIFTRCESEREGE